MPRMIAHPRQVFDERRNARQGPEGGLVTGGRRPGEQCRRDLLGLLPCQLGLAARRPLAGQGRKAPLLPGAFPTVSHLPGYAQTAGNFGRRMVLGEQFARFPATFFHRGMIACLRHAETLHGNPANVTLLYESQ